MTSKVISGFAAGAMAVLLAGVANAATCTTPATGPGEGNSGTTYTLTPALDAECYTGNDTNQIDSDFVLFDHTGWMLADKNDDAASGDGVITFLDAPENGTTSGDWTISSIAGYTVAITLKAGNGFGAFLVDMTTGDWMTSKDLSHASIYYKEGGDTPPIPLPAAGWMMIAGLGGLVAARRRKG